MNQPYFEDIELGYEIGPLVKQPSHEEVKVFTGITHLAGRFVSEDAARAEGLERVIVSSWQNEAYLAQLLTNWMGQKGTLSTLDVIFRSIVRLGDRLECRAVVTETLIRRDQHVVILDTFMENQRGERPLQGTAEILLPSRSSIL